jgi:hypothetical protein
LAKLTFDMGMSYAFASAWLRPLILTEGAARL